MRSGLPDSISISNGSTRADVRGDPEDMGSGGGIRITRLKFEYPRLEPAAILRRIPADRTVCRIWRSDRLDA